MRALFLLLLLIPFPSSAEEQDLQVEVDPKVYPSGAFEGKGVKSSSIPERVRREDALPGRQEREAAFARVAGLKEELAKMDELDRDILYVRAKTKTLKELRNFYPSLPEKKLAILQKELRKK